jgi:succinate--hydroxymethylglutarate CoA-transferase
MVVEIVRSGQGPTPTLGTPIKVDGDMDLEPAPPPALGAHTDEVLGGLLKYPCERIDALRLAGVIA